jgi:hypothetical protein
MGKFRLGPFRDTNAHCSDTERACLRRYLRAPAVNTRARSDPKKAPDAQVVLYFARLIDFLHG